MWGEQLTTLYNKRKAHIVPMTKRSANVGLLPAPRVSSSWMMWLALRGAEVHDQATGHHFGSTSPYWEMGSRDVLEVEEVRGLTHVDELRGHLFTHVACKRSDRLGTKERRGVSPA
jgi:hypothetical protein